MREKNMKRKNRIAVSAIGVLLMMLASMFLIPAGASANQLFSTAQNLFTDTSYMLQYPSVYNGNLWITASRSGLSAIVYKYNVNTLELVTKTTLTNGEAECFTAQEYKGLLYIPAISNPGPYGSVTILNATTLKQVAFINASSVNLMALLEAVIDWQRGNMYFGADPHNGKLGFYSVPLSQTLDSSAYNFVTIAPDPDNRNSESQVVIWNGLVYVLTCSGYVDGTAQGIVRTRLYRSSDLVNWVMDWEVTGMNSNKGFGGYFSHITASSDYLMCGYLRDTTGVTTYGFSYTSENETSWTEVNSNVTESGAEDHPTVNAISPDLFIWETSARETSNVVTPHQISVFNATSKTLTSLLQEGNGYNDRCIGIDADNLKLYIANCYDYSQGLAFPRSQILQLSWNFPIEIPQYLLDQSQPNPIPTPSPSVTPTLRPRATLTPPTVMKEQTNIPTTTTVTLGTVSSGSVDSLSANDNIDLAIKSVATSGSKTIDWYSTTKINVTPSAVNSLTIIYGGDFSKSQSQTLYLYNFAYKTWQSINTQTVCTQDTRIAYITNTPANYISTNGDIQLRTYATQRISSSFTCNADYTQISIKYTE
jgi:hypothetical protein